jgi:hemerythrin superfamily protein
MSTAARKAPTKSAPTKSTSPRNAVQLLTSDHREVKALFKQYEKLAQAEAAGGERKRLADTICSLLTVHATIEEEIFYPAAREALSETEGEDLLDEAEVEHASAKDLIAQITSMGPDDELYDAKVKVLGEYIDHHVQEEEGEMFPQVKESDMDLKDIGLQLQARKAELLADSGQDDETTE